MPPLDESRSDNPTAGSASFRALLVLLMAVAGSGFAGCTPKEAASPEILDGVKFVYHAGDPLQDTVKRDILNLASRQGATNVELVEIRRAATPDILWAMVKERANVSNRVERLRELHIGISWDRAGLLPFKRVDRRTSLQLRWDETHCNLLLLVNGASNRIRLDTKIPVEIADDIVQRFLTSNARQFMTAPVMVGKSFQELIEDATTISIERPNNDRSHDYRYRITLWRDEESGDFWVFKRDPETSAISEITAGDVIK